MTANNFMQSVLEEMLEYVSEPSAIEFLDVLGYYAPTVSAKFSDFFDREMQMLVPFAKFIARNEHDRAIAVRFCHALMDSNHEFKNQAMGFFAAWQMKNLGKGRIPVSFDEMRPVLSFFLATLMTNGYESKEHSLDATRKRGDLS